LVCGWDEANPPEAETLFAYGRSMETANLPFFRNLQTQKTTHGREQLSPVILLLGKVKKVKLGYIIARSKA